MSDEQVIRDLEDYMRRGKKPPEHLLRYLISRVREYNEKRSVYLDTIVDIAKGKQNEHS